MGSIFMVQAKINDKKCKNFSQEKYFRYTIHWVMKCEGEEEQGRVREGEGERERERERK